jgi:hypothetical protein
VVFFDPFSDFSSAANNIRPTQSEATAAARRRHDLEVEVERLLKDLVIIFVFLSALYCSMFFFFELLVPIY